MCRHYGTTAIIRDFPFAPLSLSLSLFFSLVRTRLYRCIQRRGSCREKKRLENERNEPRMAFQPRWCVYTATRRWKEPWPERRSRRGGNGGGYNRGLMKPVEVRQTGSASSPFATLSLFSPSCARSVAQSLVRSFVRSFA